MLLFGQNSEVYIEKKDCATQGIFNYYQKNDKREAAENPLPHFSIMTINLVLLRTHISNIPPPYTL